MSEPKPKRASVYPKETKGSKMAAEIRKETNNLSDEQREESFELAMRMIYGGNNHANVRNR